MATIPGGMDREEWHKAQRAFPHDAGVQVLVATDTAGEGINLQHAHLMVNGDLPWNRSRIERRFERMHRIKRPIGFIESHATGNDTGGKPGGQAVEVWIAVSRKHVTSMEEI